MNYQKPLISLLIGAFFKIVKMLFAFKNETLEKDGVSPCVVPSFQRDKDKYYLVFKNYGGGVAYEFKLKTNIRFKISAAVEELNGLVDNLLRAESTTHTLSPDQSLIIELANLKDYLKIKASSLNVNICYCGTYIQVNRDIPVEMIEKPSLMVKQSSDILFD